MMGWEMILGRWVAMILAEKKKGEIGSRVDFPQLMDGCSGNPLGILENHGWEDGNVGERWGMAWDYCRILIGFQT